MSPEISFRIRLNVWWEQSPTRRLRGAITAPKGCNVAEGTVDEVNDRAIWEDRDSHCP
jgi:hypothetical protein